MLTNLQDLQLGYGAARCVQTSMLSGMSSLTCLQVKGLWGSSVLFEPGALVGKTQLRQLKIRGCSIAGGSAGVEQLLFNIQQLKQLTYLNLKWSLYT